MNYVIIGAGPAGMAAADVLARTAQRDGGRITVLSADPEHPYSRMALPYFLAGIAAESGFRLAVPPGIDLQLGCTVGTVDTERREVVSAAGRTYPYDRLLIAPGADPEKPAVEGSTLPFVFTIRHLADVQGILQRLPPPPGRVIIAGAGPVGMETADAFYRQDYDVTLVISSRRVFSQMLDEQSAEVVEKRLSERGVEIRKGEDIAATDEHGEVRFRSGARQKADIVVFGKGVKPACAFLTGSGIAVERGISVDARQETNIPGVYAAGDAVETWDIAHEAKRVNALWPLAVEQAKVAALNMAGIPAAYPGGIARNILRVFDLSLFAAGMAGAEGPDVRRAEGAEFSRKLVLDNGVLKGAIFIGDVRNEGLVVSLMQRRSDASALGDILLQGSCPYGRLFRRALKH